MTRWLVRCFLVLAWGVEGQPLEAQEEFDETLPQQVERQAAEITELRQRLERFETIFGEKTVPDPDSCSDRTLQRLPLVAEVPVEVDCDSSSSAKDYFGLNYYTDFDKGFVLRPFDQKTYPFELKVNGWTQLRYHGFARDTTSWTDNAGVTRPVQNRSAFDVERARLVFSGYAVDPRLTYFVQMDGDTDGGHAVDFFDYFWSWEFSDSFSLQMGKRKVPGSRQWLISARRTRLVDRPMADDFFRPDRTVGIFGVGTIGETGHYEVMVGNAYFSANRPNAATDNQFTYAVTNYFDPWGDFGGQLVDYRYTETPLIRLGHSFVYSPQQGILDGVPLDEADFVRLSDGTRLTQTGALAPGVTVTSFDIFLYELDAAWKWRGWSVDAEVFLRWIQQIESTGPVPNSQLFQHGFYVEGGKFLIPEVLDVNARYSQVAGEFGTATEYAAGLNWYPLHKATMKVTFDVTQLNGSPLQKTASDILVGDRGTLFRLQFQAEF